MSIIALYLVFAMLAVIYFDATRFIIPNWLVGNLLALYPIAFFMSPATIDWQMDLAAMLLTFAIGYVIFALRLMGGGDVKLIIVLALWVGWEKLAMFGFNFAVLGGILSIIILLARKAVPYTVSNKEKLPRVLKDKQPVPYGLAIAGAFLMMLYTGDISVVPIK